LSQSFPPQRRVRRLHRLVSVICVICGCIFAGKVQAQDLLPELVRRIKPSAVAIETFDSRGEKLSRGSGFFVENDRIVTNRHVLENAHRAEVHSSTGVVFPVRGVLAVDAEGDIALLKIDAPAVPIRPLPLDKTSP
jgi:S1-C subfamily serine protease